MLDRTWYNTLANAVPGVPGTGSVWDKEDVDALMDAIDAEVTAQTIQGVACIVSNSGVQAWGSGSWADVPWTQEIYDAKSMHAPSSPYVVVPSPGLYLINAVVTWPSVVGGLRGIAIVANNAFIVPGYVVESPDPSTGAHTSRLTGVCQIVAAGHWFSLQLYQNSGASLNFQAGNLHLEVVRLGAY